MEKTFTTIGKQFLFGCIGLVAGVFMATGVQYVLAWTGPTAAPPGNNVAAPINVSATAQTKAGPLTVGANVISQSFSDLNNGGYYLDPNGVSRLNDIRPTIMYDGDNTGYYVDPNNGSRMNYVAADNMHAYGNIGTGGYIDTNDVWLRSVGKWASTVANQPSCNWGGQVGIICGGRSEYWSVYYTCTNGVVTDMTLVWTGC